MGFRMFYPSIVICMEYNFRSGLILQNMKRIVDLFLTFDSSAP